MLTIDDLERKFYQEKYAPGLSTGRVIERENLVFNGFFRVNANGWAANNVAVNMARDNTKQYDTGFSNKGTWTATAASTGLNHANQRIPVTVGKTYTGSAFVRMIPNGTAFIMLRWYDAAVGGTQVGSLSSVPVNVDDVNWTRVSLSDVSPVGATHLFIQVTNVAGNINDQMWVSGVTVEEGNIVKPAFDGDTADFNNGSYEWTGAANASISRLYVPEPVLRENFSSNPSLESNLGFWGIWGGSGGGVAINTREVSGGVVGNGFIRGTWTVASTGNGDISCSVNDPNLFKPGDVVSFSVWVRANTARAWAPSIQWQDAVGSPVNTSFGPNTPVIPANTWFQLKMENAVMPAGCTRLKVMARTATNMAVGDVLDVDACIIERGPTVGEYFDGDHPYAFWTGTPNGSSSRLIDVNARDQSFRERSFWAKLSGLPATATLADHQMAALKLTEPAGTVNDMLRSFFARQSGLPAKSSASDHEIAFYQTQLGVS